MSVEYLLISSPCRLSSVDGSSWSQYVQQITNHPTETHRTRLVPFAPQNILDIL